MAPALRLAFFTLSHTVLFIFSLWAAYALRFDLVVPLDHLQTFRLCLPWFLLVKLTVFFSLRQFHGSWRYVTFADLASLLYAATLSLLIIVALTHFVFPASFPRSVLLLDYLLTVTILGGLRASWRLVREQYWPRLFGPECRAALLVGADHRTALLASQIHAHPELGYRIRGFLAINGEPIGVRFGDIPVVGRVDEAASIAERYCAKEILVTSGVLPGHRLRQLMEICRRAGVGLKIMPPPEDRFSGTATIPLRDIEIEDLLRREPVVLDSTAVRQLIAGRTVMVTGAGGSIGSEICRQVIRFHPHTLVLLGRGENRIFALENELRASGQPCVLTSCIGDVTDRSGCGSCSRCIGRRSSFMPPPTSTCP